MWFTLALILVCEVGNLSGKVESYAVWFGKCLFRLAEIRLAAAYVLVFSNSSYITSIRLLSIGTISIMVNKIGID